jgi:hypothetical protein
MTEPAPDDEALALDALRPFIEGCGLSDEETAEVWKTWMQSEELCQRFKDAHGRSGTSQEILDWRLAEEGDRLTPPVEPREWIRQWMIKHRKLA